MLRLPPPPFLLTSLSLSLSLVCVCFECLYPLSPCLFFFLYSVLFCFLFCLFCLSFFFTFSFISCYIFFVLFSLPCTCFFSLSLCLLSLLWSDYPRFSLLILLFIHSLLLSYALLFQLLFLPCHFPLVTAACRKEETGVWGCSAGLGKGRRGRKMLMGVGERKWRSRMAVIT